MSKNYQKALFLVIIVIAAVLTRGLRTADIKSEGTTLVSTTEMGEAIVGELAQLAA